MRARPLAVTSIDTVVEGTHFELSTHSPADVGWKSLATALSDLAAMGAGPGEAYVSLVLPKGFGGALDLVEAMEELATDCGVTIAGGDVAGGPALVVTVAVTGWAEREDELIGRGGASPGDLVGVTGELGGSEAGRRLLEDGERTPEALVERHLRPRPRMSDGLALAAAGVSAMIDLSDGLATDAGHVARSSGVQLRVELERLPLSEGVTAEQAARGGDDYELLVTVPRSRAEEAGRAAGLTWIGEVVAGEGLVVLGPDGQEIEGLRGFEHG